MTIKEALGRIRDMAMTARYRDGEFRVNYINGKEVTAYYTNSPEDAIATASHMRDTQQNGKEPDRG